jgi:nitronate monooxygenase
LILVCAGAGGLAGVLNPMPFIREVKEFFDGTILLAGAMSSGQDVASALQMGADLAYMGTRFINTDESKATDEYRDMIIKAGCSDIVYTAAISGVSANFLGASLEAAGITEEQMKAKVKIDFGKEMDTEAIAWKTIWSAGQGSATIKDSMPAATLIARMKAEFKAAIEKQIENLKKYS